MIGGNDLVQYGRSVNGIIESQKHALQNLLNAGARYILILNLPDISKAPIFKFRTDSDSIQKQIAQYNEKLQQIVTTLQRTYGTNVKIRLFDFHSLLNDVLAHPGYYHIRNITQSCLDADSIEPGVFLLKTERHTECVDPEDYLFWDMLYPTTHAHRLLALAIYDFISAAFDVPPPAGLSATVH